MQVSHIATTEDEGRQIYTLSHGIAAWYRVDNPGMLHVKKGKGVTHHCSTPRLYSEVDVVDRVQRLIDCKMLPYGRKRKSSGRARDSQVSKVYNSERALQGNAGWMKLKDGSNHGYTIGGRLETVSEIEAFVAKVTSTELWRTQLRGPWYVRVKDGRGRRSACAFREDQSISMTPFSRCKLIVLHELAHLVGDPALPWHGWEFCSNYLTLVERFIDKQTARDLREQFKAHKVKYKKPRAKRALTEEQRVELRERMAAARAARNK